MLKPNYSFTGSPHQKVYGIIGDIYDGIITKPAKGIYTVAKDTVGGLYGAGKDVVGGTADRIGSTGKYMLEREKKPSAAGEGIISKTRSGIGAVLKGAVQLGAWPIKKAGRFMYDGTVRVLQPGAAVALNTVAIAGNTLNPINIGSDIFKLGTSTPINLIAGSTRLALGKVLGLGGIFSKRLESFANKQVSGAQENFKSAFDLNILHNAGMLLDTAYKGSIATGVRIPQTYTNLAGWKEGTAALNTAGAALSRPLLLSAMMTREKLQELNKRTMGNLFPAAANDDQYQKAA